MMASGRAPQLLLSRGAMMRDSRFGSADRRDTTVAPASTITNSPFQDWLVRENRVGASVYLSVNALKRGTALRRRRAVAAVRHVFLDADENLTAVLATIAGSSRHAGALVR